MGPDDVTAAGLGGVFFFSSSLVVVVVAVVVVAVVTERVRGQVNRVG